MGKGHSINTLLVEPTSQLDGSIEKGHSVNNVGRIIQARRSRQPTSKESMEKGNSISTLW